MSKKKNDKPPVKAVPNEEEEDCTSDICNDCAQKMIDQGLCPDCGGPIDECGAGEPDARKFDNCIRVKTEDDEIPIVIVGSEGKHYVGAMAEWDDEGMAWLLNALTYAEFIDKGSLMCGFQKPLMNVSVPETLAIKIGTLYFLNKDLKTDMQFAQTYLDALTRGKAKDSGLVLPNASPVSGLQ
jgi:hypothetical protein